MLIFRKINKIFDKRTKIKLVLLIAAIIFGSMLEMAALALISPFISVLLDPSVIYTNPYILWAYEFLGFINISYFLAFLTFILAGVYIFRGIYMYVINRIKFRFLAVRQADLSERLLAKILGYSYIYHTNHNIADMQRIVIGDVEQLFVLLINILRLITDFFVTVFILVFLIILSPVMTLFVGVMSLVCVLLYLGIYKNKVRNAGIKNRKAGIGMIKATNQALGGIKEVKLLQREGFFQSVFKRSSYVFVNAFTQYRALDALPKLVLETTCFGGAFLLMGFFILGGVDISEILPQLSLFVLAAFRLLPAVSRQLNFANIIMFNLPSVDAVYSSIFEEEILINSGVFLDFRTDSGTDSSTDSSSDLGQDIIVKDLTYHYPTTPEPVVSNVSFIIPEKKSVAFIGPSGAGKTTLIDLILGVLSPDSGGVFYKGKSIHHNFNNWSRQVGYIPQQIYLLDESIRENVAFGISKEEIDDNKIWRALEQAQLKEFVESLPQKLDTVVGDRGIRLSGGQRQRVGIARAMYEDPPILVLDEATSSLDNENEKAVMDAVMGFKGNKTMLIVAHRLSTIEHCDIVYKVEGQKVYHGHIDIAQKSKEVYNG